MIRTLFPLSLLLLVSCKEFAIKTSTALESFKCPQEENCLSSLNSGKSQILHFKMMGEDEIQNILNLSKLVKSLPDSRIEKLDKNYLYITKGKVHIEFMASQKERKIHIRSQVSKTGLFGEDKGKGIIEEIRFKFYQNDY